MKKFNEFLAAKEAPAPNPGDKFVGGIGQDDVGNTMTSLRRMLSTRGVADSSADRQEMRKIISTLRPPMQRLVQMGLGPDSVLQVVQAVISMITSKAAPTSFNLGRVGKAIGSSIN